MGTLPKDVMPRFQRVCTAVLLSAFCTVASPWAAAQDAAAVNVPKNSCKKPDYPGRLASDTQKRVWRKDVDGYSECIKKYIAAQQKSADEFVKAANGAIEEYNTAVKEFQEEMNKAAQ